MHKLKVSIAQMNSVARDVKRNFELGASLIEEASRQGGQIVLLPEMWICGLDMSDLPPIVNDIENIYMPKLLELAQKNNIMIIGSMPYRENDKIYNSSIIISNEGKIICQYNKIHLVNLVEFSEDVFIERGKNLNIVETPYGKIATIICYDTRFPELARKLALAGAKILFIPAAWPAQRKEHWKLLVRARAVENQMFVVACNMYGESNNIEMGGHSAIIDPWGEAMLELGSSQNVATVEIDLDTIDKVRNTITCFMDYKEEYYTLK